MNRGDTSYLMLCYTINGEPLYEGGYDEIELTINKGSTVRCVRKLLSRGEIEWGTLNYMEDGVGQEFTGYYTHLSQQETFKLQQGANEVQLRILADNEVGSSAITSLNLGQVLSSEVLIDGNSQ